MTIDDVKLAFYKKELGVTEGALNELAVAYFKMRLGV